MVQYYRDMWTGRSHVLAPLTDSDNGPKGKNILWNEALESFFKQLKRMVSAETLLSYPDRKLTFKVHTDASDKQLGCCCRSGHRGTKAYSLWDGVVPNPSIGYDYL